MIFPLVAPVGTVALVCVSEFTVDVVATMLLKLTPVAPVKATPVRITVEPPARPVVIAMLHDVAQACHEGNVQRRAIVDNPLHLGVQHC